MNLVALEARLVNNVIYSQFSVGGGLVTPRYELHGETLRFEVTSSKPTGHKTGKGMVQVQDDCVSRRFMTLTFPATERARFLAVLKLIKRGGEKRSQAVRELRAAVPWGHHASALATVSDAAARLLLLTGSIAAEPVA
jgi:hypothetical protein